MGREALFAFEQNVQGFACSTDLQRAYIPSGHGQQFLITSGKLSLQQVFSWAKDLGSQRGKGLHDGNLRLLAAVATPLPSRERGEQ